MWLSAARQPPDLHVVVSTNRRSRRATYAAVCSKRATLLGNVDRANRKAEVRAELTKRLDVKPAGIRGGGDHRNTTPEYWIDG